MAFLRLKTPNSHGRKGEVITREQAIQLEKLQADYASQTPEVKAKLDNILGIYKSDKPKPVQTTAPTPQQLYDERYI